MIQIRKNKYTEFTKKQINVIYANAKQKNIQIEKWVMSEFYDLADFCGYDDNRSVEESEFDIKKILECVFNKDYKKAQMLIDNYTTNTFKSLSYKAQEQANREFI